MAEAGTMAAPSSRVRSRGTICKPTIGSVVATRSVRVCIELRVPATVNVVGSVERGNCGAKVSANTGAGRLTAVGTAPSKSSAIRTVMAQGTTSHADLNPMGQILPDTVA
jgi:hypothetical protein